MDKKVVLITGGSRGIGAATSMEFAKLGYDLAINYVSDDSEANRLKKEIEDKYKVDVLLIKSDISNEENVKGIVKDVLNKYDKIDILINNAGIAIDSTLEGKTVENFKKILNTNLIGTFLMCKYVGLEMLKNRNGSIVNISSTNGIDSFYPFSMDYDASKAGVISLTHNFAKEYAPYIRVNSIAPGWVNTDMNKQLDDDFKEEELSHILLDRFAEPDEIAKEIVHVANSTYLNDSIIKVDGCRC